MDPFGSMNNMATQARSFFSNPFQFMMEKRMNVPPGVGNNPNDILQYLLNSGQVTQDQFNKASKAAKSLQSNPQVMKIFEGARR